MGNKPCGDADDAVLEGAIMALPSRMPQPARVLSRPVVAVSWCSRPAMVAASSAPHIHAVLTSAYPLGRCRRAAPCLLSRKMFSILFGAGTSTRPKRPCAVWTRQGW